MIEFALTIGWFVLGLVVAAWFGLLVSVARKDRK